MNAHALQVPTDLSQASLFISQTPIGLLTCTKPMMLEHLFITYTATWHGSEATSIPSLSQCGSGKRSCDVRE